MRINKFLALNTSLSRRRADEAVANKRVKINGKFASNGSQVSADDLVLLDEVPVRGDLPEKTVVLLNKPTGYVCSRRGQGSKTIYDLLPKEYSSLNPAGRLDKDSSGLLLLTNDGDLLYELSHPSKEKEKVYEVILNLALSTDAKTQIENGVKLDDGISKMKLQSINKSRFEWQVTMHEGRNRQIRRTFKAVGYEVIALRRISFGDYKLNNLAVGAYIKI